MKKKITTIPWGLLLALCLPAIGYFQQPTAMPEVLALVGVKIYPSPFEEAILDGTVLVQGGKIQDLGSREKVKIPSDARVLDCTGGVLMAGFWNSHVHFMEPQWQGAGTIPATRLNRQLKEMLTRYGFTHAFDLATLDLPNLLLLRCRIEKGEVEGPDIMTAGVPFTSPDGSPFYIAPLKLPELGTPEQARKYVQRQLEAGADAIKLWSASPNGVRIVTMPMEVIQAATATAHQDKIPVFAHPTNLEGVKIAAAGGVDILTHVAADDLKDWDTRTIEAMRVSRMALIPTLKLHVWELERSGLATENNLFLKTAIQQLRSFHEAGGDILFGTDVGYMSDYSPEEEYILMAEAGMDHLQILAALTTTPAKRFAKQKQSGKVAVGMDADLVVLSADPVEDIRNFSKMKYTIRKGKVIYP